MTFIYVGENKVLFECEAGSISEADKIFRLTFGKDPGKIGTMPKGALDDLSYYKKLTIKEASEFLNSQTEY